MLQNMGFVGMLGWIHKGLQFLITATPLRTGTLHGPKAVLPSALCPLTTDKVNKFLLVLRVEKCCTHRGTLSSSQPPKTAFKNYTGRKGEVDMKRWNCESFAGRKRMIAAGREGSRACRNQQKYEASNTKCQSGRVKIKGHVEGAVTECTFIWQKSILGAI